MHGTNLVYLKILPHNDHVLDHRAWVANPPLVRFAPLGGGLVNRRFYRFLVVVDEGKTLLYLGCPPEAENSILAAMRGFCPKVDFIPTEHGEIEDLLKEVKFVGALHAQDPLAPFNCDDSLVEFPSVLEALGAGRRIPARGVLDVCFAPEPPGKWRSKIEAEVARMRGVPAGGGALSVFGGTGKAVTSVLFGSKPSWVGGRPVPPVSPLTDQARIQAYAKRALGCFFSVWLRFGAAADERLAKGIIAAAGNCLQSLSWYNKFVWKRGSGSTTKAVREGKILFGEPRIVMTASELAQIVVVPGQEMERVWFSLERMTSKTAPPPHFLLLGEAGNGESEAD